MAMQTALERALPIVAAAYGEQFGVKVVLSGSDAYTDGETIVLPMLKGSEMAEILFGYLAHEAAHVRFSNFGTLKKVRNQVEAHCANIIEDIWIEGQIQEVFPGTQFTLERSWTYIVEQGMSPPATTDMNEASQLLQYLLHRLMSEKLHREASLPLAKSSQDVVEKNFPLGFFVRLDGLLGKYLDNLSSSDDCLKLARAILKALREAEEEEHQQQSQNQPKGGDSSQDDQSQIAKGSDGQSGEGSKPQSDQADLPKGEEANQKKDGTEPTEANGNPGQGEPAGPSSLVQPRSDSSDGKGQVDGTGASLHERLMQEADLPKDAMEQLKGQLADQAREDNGGHSVSIDSSSVGSDAVNKGETSGLGAGILASSAIRSRLLGLLQAQTCEKQWLHTKGKRVDGTRLTRLVHGDSRVFLKREELKRPDTAVHVLLDSSGSMNRIQSVANQATVSLALAISTVPKCDIAVSMFPGLGGAVSPVLHRGQNVRANLGRFAVTSSGGTPLAEAMLFGARELAGSHRNRKVMIIITDGEPNDGSSVKYMTDLIERNIDIYAIGIASTAVSRYFRKWSVINNVKELQAALFTIAGQFLELH
jgi:cobaltochelatase CobT